MSLERDRSFNRSGDANGASVERGGAAAKNVTITRKVHKFLDVTVDDSLRKSLEYVQDFYGENTVKSRRTIRPTLEQRVLALHEEFLEKFRHVNTAFQNMASGVDDLVQSCDGAHQVLSKNQQESSALLATVSLLHGELQEVRQKEVQVQEFMSKYQLTPEEANVLKGEVNPRFIEVLLKVKDIHHSCRDLLSVEHQQAAVEIMESMYLAQISAYDRLTRHLLSSVCEILTGDTPDFTDNFVAEARALRDRPAQWAKVMEEIVRVRKSAVVRRFFNAMTKGAGCDDRPLEMQAHDTVRFVGDVMAWVHQCIAEEADMLDMLFGNSSGRAPSPAASTETPDSTVDPQAASSGGDVIHVTKADMVDQIFEALCKHLKVRVEQAIDAASAQSASSSSGQVGTSALVVYFKLEGIVAFYYETTSQLLGANAALTMMIQEIKLNVLRVFFEMLKTLSTKLLQSPSVPKDLSTPPAVHDAISKLKAMMESVQSSVVPHSSRESDFTPVLTAIVDPILTIPSKPEDMDKMHRVVLRMNICTTMQTALAPFDFTTAKQEKLTTTLDTDINDYVAHHTQHLLQKLSFEEKLAALRNNEELSTSAMQETLQSFYSYVYNVGTLNIPLIDNVQGLRARDQCYRRITGNVCQAYEDLYTEYHRKAGDAAKDVAFHTPQQIRVLLDVA